MNDIGKSPFSRNTSSNGGLSSAMLVFGWVHQIFWNEDGKGLLLWKKAVLNHSRLRIISQYQISTIKDQKTKSQPNPAIDPFSAILLNFFLTCWLVHLPFSQKKKRNTLNFLPSSFTQTTDDHTTFLIGKPPTCLNDEPRHTSAPWIRIRIDLVCWTGEAESGGG